MSCKNCQEKPVIKLPNSNVKLCKNHFIRHFERKVLKSIRNFKLLKKGEKIGVAISGGKDSLTVLNILNMIKQRKRIIELAAIAIDEGIHGYRSKTLEDAKNYCKKNKIKLDIFSYKKEFGLSLDEMLKRTNKLPCTVCGVLRRYLLNKKSRELKFDKLATGHNLDDEAQTIIMNQFRRNIETSARLGPLTGVKKDKRFIRRIKPLYLMTEKEVATYSFLKNLSTKYAECPNARDGYRDRVREMLSNFETMYPGTKQSIITSFLEILPVLKKEYKDTTKINSCKKCGEPCSQEICQACNVLAELRIK